MAFKSMLKFEYTLLEETNVMELFEAIYVADKYLLHQVIVMIEDKVEMFMIQEHKQPAIRLLVFFLAV